MRIALKSVKIEEIRFRDDFGDIEDLAASIKKHGQLVPIILEKGTNRLIAGERRTLALQFLGITDVDVVYQEDLSEIEIREIELAENLARKDMSWQEQVTGYAEIVRLKQELYGIKKAGMKSRFGDDSGISQDEIAKSLGVSKAQLSQDLSLAEGLKLMPSLRNEAHKTTAFKKYRRKIAATVSKELLKREWKDSERLTIKQGDARVHIKEVLSGSTDLILFDPPYGIELEKSAAQSRTGSTADYELSDTLEYSQALCHELFQEFNRVMKPQSCLFCFFPIQYYQWFFHELAEVFTKEGVRDIPLIWNKGSGGQPYSGYGFSTAYESMLYVRKGTPMLYLDLPDVFSYSRVASQKRIHIAERPLELYKDLILASTTIGATVLDPTFGSGASLEAALLLGRKAIGFEYSEVHCARVMQRLEDVKPEELETKDDS